MTQTVRHCELPKDQLQLELSTQSLFSPLRRPRSWFSSSKIPASVEQTIARRRGLKTTWMTRTRVDVLQVANSP